MEDYKDEDWLRREYVEKGRNGTDIADEFDVHHQSIYYYLDKFGIEKRSRGASEGEDNPAWKGGNITVDCPTCGGTFEAKRYRAKNAKHGPFCSRECLYKHRSEHCGGDEHYLHGADPEDHPHYGRTGEDHPMYGVRGEDHPLWKGGYEQDFRESAEWYNTRREALERDGEECADCGMSRDQHHATFDRDLEVHHIKPVSDGGDKYDLSNLVSLCMPCHHERHREL